METVTVLLLEDHEGEARLNQRLLERSHTVEFRFTSVRALSEAQALLESSSFDVLLLDLNLPDSRGIDTFDRIQEIAPHLPVVIISAVADERLAMRCIRHGAQDYLVKGSITSEIMTRVVRYAMARKAYEPVRQMRNVGWQLPPGATFLLDRDGMVHGGLQLAQLLRREGSVGSIMLARYLDEADREVFEAMRARVTAQHIAETCLLTLRGGPDGEEAPMLLLLAPWEGQGPDMLLGGLLPAHASLYIGSVPDDKYRALVEHSQDGVFIVLDGRIVFANSTLAELTGYAHEELLNQSLELLIAPEDRESVLARYRERVAGEDAQQTYEFSLLTKSGLRRKVLISVGRLPLGDQVAAMGTLKDVSEQRRTAYLMNVQHQLAVDLAYTHDIADMFERILSAVLRIESVDVAGIFVLDAESGSYALRATRGVRDLFSLLDGNADFRRAHEHIVRESAPRYMSDTDFDVFPFADQFRAQGLRCMAVIPVTHGGRIIASVDIASLTYPECAEGTRQAVESIASYLGGVLTRLATEEALRESETLYRAVVEKSHDAIFIQQEDRLLFANERTCELTGYSREELLSINAWSLIHPDDRKRIQSAATARREGADSPVVYEGRVLTRDGTIRSGEFAATIIRYQRQPASLVTVRDITSRKSHEEEVRRSDTLLRSAGFAASRFLQSPDWEEAIDEVLEHFGDAANVCRVLFMQNLNDEQGVSRMYRRHVWVRREMRESVLERVPDGQSWQEEPYARWAGELSAGRSIAAVIDHLSDEEQMTLARQSVRSTSIVPVFSGDSWWGLLRFDECRLRRTWLNSEIEAMVVCAQTLGAAIHRKQAEEELVAEKERAERADEIKKAFIANMSHEVRTPLNIILGYLALVTELTGDGPDDETREFLRAIEDASQRLIRTVDSIMNISRFQASDIALQRLPIRLDRLVAGCVERFRRQTEEKQLSLNFTSRCSVPEIVADQHYLTESIDHLIDNAIKFTPRGSVTLELDDGSAGGPRLLVHDTGIGIAEDFLERMYEPYVQEEIGYDRSYEGIGL
ncbi:MAG: PAS domain S-box protein, partial [Bacteroidota bacterium]|nr:PAS domain S-box protein [Bacteroidota bacterium]